MKEKNIFAHWNVKIKFGKVHCHIVKLMLSYSTVKVKVQARAVKYLIVCLFFYILNVQSDKK